MFSHIFVGASDFERALAFYKPLMDVLGIQARFCQYERPWAGWQSSPGPRPLLLIGTPFDGQPHAPGNGQMAAFLAENRATVDNAFAVALAYGGTSEAMNAVVTFCKENGLMPFTNFNRVHVVPPCNASDDEVRAGLAILDRALDVADQYAQ